jgi:hypothetical protein
MPEIVKQLRPLILGDLQPRLNITVVRDEAGLAELQAYIARKMKSDGTREEHLKIAGYMEDSNA